jgi:putative protease
MEIGNKVELLAPAGDWDALIAAVENGADAIYLGGKLFNARQFAGNFDADQLKRALDYVHIRGARIYLTMNTLATDAELQQAIDFAEKAYLMGIDGIIVQDLGFAGALRRLYPDLDLHASTQMTIYNLEGVRALEQLGFKRVVLARELPLDEITYIVKNCTADIEIFVHGAMCVSYSGQCLMSSIIGGRSGNRGKCAQPCRLPYELVEKMDDGKPGLCRNPVKCDGKYLLSPKDLCSVELLDAILATGIKSLKIEGRMKNPEYVATVVRIYRKYIDMVESARKNFMSVEETDLKDLAQAFNRGGFSKGYLAGKHGRSMMSYEKPKNWGIPIGEVISYDNSKKMISLKLTDELAIGDGVEVWNDEDSHPGNIVTEIKVNGKHTDSAVKGYIVSIGSINGKIRKGNKVYKTSDKRLNTQARESFAEGRNYRKVPLRGEIVLKADAPLTLSISDMEGNTIKVEGSHIPEPAINRPITSERVKEQVCKTGSTPFTFSELNAEIDDGLTVPISEINNVRRKALELMQEKRTSIPDRKLSHHTVEHKKKIFYFLGNGRINNGQAKKTVNKCGVSVFLYRWNKDVDLASLNADRIYLPFSGLLSKDARNALEQYRDRSFDLFIWLPSITRGNYDNLIKLRLASIVEAGADGILAGNLGSITYIKELLSQNRSGDSAAWPQLMGDYSLNVFNSLSVKELEQTDVSGITLSPELTLEQIANIKETSGLLKECIVYGRLPVMTSEYCPVGSIAGGFKEGSKCSAPCDKGVYHLKDRKGMEFPVLCDKIDCRSVVLNSNVLFVADSLNKIQASGVEMMRLYISDERLEDVREIIRMHKEVIEEGPQALRKHERLIGRIRDSGFTKGHYYRGV